MSTPLPSIDKRLFELLIAPENARFTIRSLRDQYADQYGIPAKHRPALRRFIYERMVALLVLSRFMQIKVLALLKELSQSTYFQTLVE